MATESPPASALEDGRVMEGWRIRLHRNSQKRLYVPDGIYFITTNTYDRYPYFKNDILCELFLETLDFTSLIKEFNLHGFAINLEHMKLIT